MKNEKFITVSVSDKEKKAIQEAAIKTGILSVQGWASFVLQSKLEEDCGEETPQK